ncbi:hypothetical protein [Flavobacterium sp. AG291]|uniref:hypothetical protein n=1 Tax=Flavobacterium sp. AG291 TaxID=2184000 RepID=UPI000E0A0ADE|nr:hypothetical protein [Flavobacterium sp. AG291]RDI16084.1 hypothetical protein DEU42_101387 [Flavobacterium sp. AG291]
MKKIYLLSLLGILNLSCSESYQEIDPENFNSKIKGLTDIKTPQELIILYNNYPKNEARPQYEISTITKDVIYEITLIHNNIPDDSLLSEKIIMTAKKNKEVSWSVLKILKNWKCHNDRGHTNWGTEICN